MKAEKLATGTSQTHNVTTRTMFVVIINIESLPIASGQDKIVDMISVWDNSPNGTLCMQAKNRKNTR